MRFKYFIVFTIVVIGHLVAGIYFNHYSAWWIALALLVFLGITVLACIKIQWNFFITSVNRVPLTIQQFSSGIKPVALTFDDGPHECTPAILDILKQEQVPATFFVIGKNIAGKEALLQRMASEGHLIGNHSFSHSVHFDWQSTRQMKADIQQCSDAITAVTGTAPTIFRPPFGVTNPNLARAIQGLNLVSVGWTIRSMDTVAKDADALLQKILKQVKSNSTVLLHDRCPITVQILPELIRNLKERGYTFTFPVRMESVAVL
ncbi:polysaccharide deacetylase family protein [Edaphocola flava]|uniref:polysaccharide deacetylase family protein n=1 Tax=Edaphocola flava TaxID=2499629 RepID=UPI00100AA5CC|nr:polysaccharide deacetylase family protein [Edaphocola flava]